VNVATQFTTSLSDCRNSELVGGKAASLGDLIRAGFPVPTGFVIDTRAYRLAHTSDPERTESVPADIADEVRQRYHAMGGGSVAVRSSATVEDLAAASMAGQCDTFLDVDGDEALLDAVRRCWASLRTPRIRTYLEQHQIEYAQVAMAVVVQRLVPSDVAGVLFTVDPNGGRDRMVIEASWGLGETVVGGRVQPDVLRLEATTGRVLSASIADKAIYVAAGAPGERPVEEGRRTQACLSSRDVHALWQLGRQVEQHCGAPRDIEWAIHNSRVFLLQARPITTWREADAVYQIISRARQHLHQERAAGRGPWVQHNLAETLPHPTRFTWSVIKRFMSGAGGFGAMYRRVGFQPSPAVDHEGFLELIAGQVYMDVSRAPEMFGSDFPFAYDLATLDRDPDASQKAPSIPCGSFSMRMKAARLLANAGGRIKSLSESADVEFRSTTAPAIQRWVAKARRQDLGALSTEELIAHWHEREHQVLDIFGPETLLPSLICGMVWTDLETFLEEHFWDERPDALARLVAAGGTPDRTIVSDAELYEVATGRRNMKTWIAANRHRGPSEFDLAAPRWREQPERLHEMAARLATGEAPLERFQRAVERAAAHAATLRAQLSSSDAREFDRRLVLVHRFMPFREEGKDFLMLAYDELRRLALELGRRLEIGEGVFHLTPAETFDALRVGYAPHHLIEERQLAYQAESRLTLPRVIDASTIERLGTPTDVAMTAGAYQGLSLSTGRACGPARVLHSATEAGDFGSGYVLVCPSTDPAWTPLFINAVGLVLECGGTLSHGAVVAREMGLPATVVPDATRCFRTGEYLEIDGNSGRVRRVAETAGPPLDSPAQEVIDPDDTEIPQTRVPPLSGTKDQRAAWWRNAMLGIWTLYLLGFFFLPAAYVRQPSLAVMDAVFWPIVRALGGAAVVAIMAIAVAAVTLIAQKLATSNRALVEAKRRAAVLTREAASLPDASPRRTVMTRLVASVDRRVAMARLVPVCLLLGPLVLPFIWLRDRLDPSVPTAAASSPVQVVATVDGDWNSPVRIQVPSDTTLDETTPVARTLPPIRKTLERLLALYREPPPNQNGPWELQFAPDLGRMQAANDLQRYLDNGMPPRGLTWTVRPPAGASRRFPVSVATEGHSPVTLTVVLGNDFPPAATTVSGPPDSPIKQLRVAYQTSPQRRVFWQPFAGLAGHSDVAAVQWLAARDVGWLWLYLAAYLPALAILRPLMRVA
jgi:phosphohistidine swiveling domain-containing protein